MSATDEIIAKSATAIVKSLVALGEHASEAVGAIRSVSEAVNGLTLAVDQHRRETVDVQRAAIAMSALTASAGGDYLGRSSDPSRYAGSVATAFGFWDTELGLALARLYPPSCGMHPRDKLAEILASALLRPNGERQP